MRKLPLIALLAIFSACQKAPTPDTLSHDASLDRDLQMANQSSPSLDSINAVERARNNYATQAAAPSNLVRTPVRQTYPVRTSRSTRSSSQGTYSTAPAEPRTVIQKNTKRDAIIGAGAGAVIGAVTSHDKVKGAVVGGVAGAILGGVLGNNVDKKRIKY